MYKGKVDHDIVLQTMCSELSGQPAPKLTAFLRDDQFGKQGWQVEGPLVT